MTKIFLYCSNVGYPLLCRNVLETIGLKTFPVMSTFPNKFYLEKSILTSSIIFENTLTSSLILKSTQIFVKI